MRGWLTGVPVESFVSRESWGDDHRRADAMRIWCEEHGVDMLALTLQYCLREERIHGNPIGSLNKSQLDANIEAVTTRVSDETLAMFSAAGL